MSKKIVLTIFIFLLCTVIPASAETTSYRIRQVGDSMVIVPCYNYTIPQEEFNFPQKPINIESAPVKIPYYTNKLPKGKNRTRSV